MRVRVFGRDIHNHLEGSTSTYLGLQYSYYSHNDNLKTQVTGKFVNKFRDYNN